jgi:ParB family chromosome partitioning protein
MKPKNRSYLVHSLESWIGHSQYTLHGMAKQLRQTGKDLPPEFTEVRSAVAACQESIAQLSAKVDALFEADDALIEKSRSTPLSDSEVTQVFGLNRQLAELTRFLKTTADDVTPRLKAKVADPNDPMFDYEIDAHIAYVLREDDPEYVEDDDNYLTTQTEYLKGKPVSEIDDWAESHIQAGLRAEPHCWLFHDLYDHGGGRESPKVSLRDCLRIGKIWVDVQISQQYVFDVPRSSENQMGISNFLENETAMVTKKPKSLGCEWETLLGLTVSESAMIEGPTGQAEGPSTPTSLPVIEIVAGQYQPRTRMDEGSLRELAESIKKQGTLPPILVRKLYDGSNQGKYEIIAGERRFRAAKLAGLESVPVLVRHVPNEAAAAVALIENIQREDLNLLEEAQGLQRLINEFGLTHEQTAQAVGRSCSSASNLLQLLNLADPVQAMLMAGDLESNHVRVLLALDRDSQVTAANQIIAKKMSVGEAERQFNNRASP